MFGAILGTVVIQLKYRLEVKPMRILPGGDGNVGVTRREILVGTSKVVSGFALGMSAVGAPLKAQSASQKQDVHKLKVIVTGGHPGDPECGCGGTIARYSDLGHDVVLMYLNRGQAYCGPGTSDECGEV